MNPYTVRISGTLSCFITIVLFVVRASVEVDYLRSCYFRLNLFIKNETLPERRLKSSISLAPNSFACFT